MIRRIRLALLVVGAAALISACSGDVAATVDGEVITTDDVLSLRTAEVTDRVQGEQSSKPRSRVPRRTSASRDSTRPRPERPGWQTPMRPS